MKAILVDAGNTHVRVKAWPGDGARARLGDPLPLPTLLRTPTELALSDMALFRGQIDRLLEENGRPPVALVSVVPLITDAFARLNIELRIADHLCELPFALEVDEPDAVGPDRLCNVAAACGAGLDDALVVDAGTATTFDLLLEGRFIGGLIAPGMAFAARKLGEAAARLEPPAFEPRPLEPGRNTAEAMAIGAWQVGHAGVEQTLRSLVRKYPRARVVLTGGLGHHFRADGRFLDPDWTLRGAAQLTGFTI